jgi:hypothetical protein
MLIGGLAKGLIGGLIGAVVMTIGEKAEQRLTGRPDSYVPARTAARLFGLRRPNRKSVPRNWAMHYGTGAVAGMARGLMAAMGLRGPAASSAHLLMRLTTDQSLEGITGVSRPPQTWPLGIAAVDVLHKGIYAFTTGAVVDALFRSD